MEAVDVSRLLDATEHNESLVSTDYVYSGLIGTRPHVSPACQRGV